jgi:hypothetical protein
VSDDLRELLEQTQRQLAQALDDAKEARVERQEAHKACLKARDEADAARRLLAEHPEKALQAAQREGRLEADNKHLQARADALQEQLDGLQEKLAGYEHSVHKTGKLGERRLRDLLEEYFGGLGQLVDVSDRPHHGDLCFETFDGVRVLVEAKHCFARNAGLQLASKEVDKFYRDLDATGWHAGLLVSAKRLPGDNRTQVDPDRRGVLVSGTPSPAEQVHAFVQALVLGYRHRRCLDDAGLEPKKVPPASVQDALSGYARDCQSLLESVEQAAGVLRGCRKRAQVCSGQAARLAEVQKDFPDWGEAAAGVLACCPKKTKRPRTQDCRSEA